MKTKLLKTYSYVYLFEKYPQHFTLFGFYDKNNINK